MDFFSIPASLFKELFFHWMMGKSGFSLLEMLMLENEIYSVKLSLERLCHFLYLESSGFDNGVLQFMFLSESVM